MLNQNDYETILIDKTHNGVAIVTLNRPAKLNAVNAAMHYELSRLFLDAEEDSAVSAVLLTGAGRAFCAGGDFGSGLPGLRTLATSSAPRAWRKVISPRP